MPIPFSARVSVGGGGGRTSKINFLGTIDEMLALGGIFVEEEYKPSIAPTSIADLGANIGIASVWFALRYPKAEITAYEANPDLIPNLRRNVEPLGVRVENKAVTHKNGPVTFFVMHRNFSSSLDQKGSSIPVTVQGISLSDIRADFLKMDIEGAEFHAAHLARAKEIVGEMHGKSEADIEKMRGELSRYACSFTKPKGTFRAILR